MALESVEAAGVSANIIPPQRDLDKLNQLAKAAQSMLGGNKASNFIRPYQQRVEFLDRELQRTHETIRAKLESRAYTHSDDSFLNKIREELLVAVEEYTAFVKELQREEKTNAAENS